MLDLTVCLIKQNRMYVSFFASKSVTISLQNYFVKILYLKNNNKYNCIALMIESDN